MRLYLQTENNNPTITDYTITVSAPNEMSVDNNVIYNYLALGTHNSITISNIIPVEIGEKCSLSLTDHIIYKSDYNDLTYVIKHNGTTVGTLSDTTPSVEFTKVNDDITIEPTIAGTSFSYTKMEILSINLQSRVRKELILIDSDKIKLTKQIKSYGKLGDTKSTFSNNISIKFDNDNYKNFGYITPMSQTDIVNYINGKNAVITDDSNNIMVNGILTIKNITKRNNNYIVNLFFNDNTIGFFNQLSSDNITLPHMYIKNDWSTKKAHQLKNIDEFEKDKDFFIYGYVDDNYQLLNNDTSEQWASNYGGILNSFEDISLNLLEVKNEMVNKIPITEGYGDFPKGAEPLVRVKPLFEYIHGKYGYEVKGEILNDPAFYNIVMSLPEKEQEPTSVDDIEFRNHIEISNSTLKDVGMPLYPTTSNPSLYTTTCPYPPGSCTTHPTYSYVREVKNSTDIDRLLGDDLNYDVSNVYSSMHGIHFNDSFKTRMVVELEVQVDYERDQPGFIRLIVADGIADVNGTASTIKATMNPFSFMFKEDIYINKLSSVTSFTYKKQLEIDKVQFDRLEDSSDLYFVRAYILGSELSMPAAYPIAFEIKVKLTELKPTYKYQPENPYYLDERDITVSEQGLVKDIINKFNLYPVVDQANKTITYNTFDEFYNTSSSTIDWSDRIDNSKDIVYDFNPKGISSSYEFNNKAISNDNLKDYNNNNPLDYQQYTLVTPYKVDKKYKIDNIIPSLFYTYSPIFDGLRGQTEQKLTEPYIPSEYAMYLDSIDTSTTSIESDQLKLHDNTPPEEDKVVYNTDKPKQSIMGYINNVIGSSMKINTAFTSGKKMMYNRNGTIDIDVDRDANATPLYTGIISNYFAYPKMLSPFNELDSSKFVTKIDTEHNIMWYNNLGYKEFSTKSTSVMGACKVINNLYDMYYSRQVTNLVTPGTHLLKGYFHLSNKDYIDGELGRQIRINNQNYIINKIANFEANKLTKVELLKWDLSLHNNVLKHSSELNSTDEYCTYMYSEDTTDFINGYAADSSGTGVGTLGFTTNYHTPGKTYTVRIKYEVIGSSVTIQNVINDGDSGTTTNINQVLSIGTGEFEYSYVRTDTNTQPFQTIVEKLNISYGPGAIKFIEINVYES